MILALMRTLFLALMKSLDNDSQPSVQGRGENRLRLCSASRSLHSGGREGNRLLILGAMESILQDFINLQNL